MLYPGAKIYVSGQISGLSEAEYKARFAQGCFSVESHGYEPINPLEVVPQCEDACGSDELFDDGSYRHTWKCYMKWDIMALFDASAIVMLDNWIHSRGAKLERRIAMNLNLPVLCFSADGHIKEMGIDF